MSHYANYWSERIADWVAGGVGPAVGCSRTERAASRPKEAERASFHRRRRRRAPGRIGVSSGRTPAPSLSHRRHQPPTECGISDFLFPLLIYYYYY